MEPLTGADLLEVILIKIPPNVLAYGDKLDKLIRMLGIVFSGKITSSDKKSYLENDYGIKISMEDERRLRDMCNLSEGFWEAGKKEEKLETLKCAINMGLSEEQMQQLMRVSAEELEELKQKLYAYV